MSKEENKKSIEILPKIVLIPWHYDKSNIRSYPYFGKREIYCGPKLPNLNTNHRRFIHTSGKFFDIGEIINKLSEEDKKVELVILNLEVGSTCFPRNLFKLDCPKVGLVADTHHLLYPISTIIHYINNEKINHILKFGQAAHLHFFYEAGIRNSAFIPCPVLEINQIKKKKSGVAYFGQKWKSSHPRRSRMVQFLAKNLPKNGIHFHWYNQLPLKLWHNLLARNKIVVLSSLNGQFTPQICNCLYAGALCFIDRLTPQSFLYQFFIPDKHLIIWQNFDDLLEKLIYYYNHPKEAQDIAKAGQIQIKKIFVDNVPFGQIISKFVFENKVDSRFLATNDNRCKAVQDDSKQVFDMRIRLYENIQELHRIHEDLDIICITKKNLKISSDLADLPRLRITHAFLSKSQEEEATQFFDIFGVKSQINTCLLKSLKKANSFDIGIIEFDEDRMISPYLISYICTLLKPNSLLWVIGNLNSNQKEIISLNGFKPFILKKKSYILKIKDISRKICFYFWKLGYYPFPYLTLKPMMELLPNLHVFLRGWQAHLPFLY